jgi:hypothetical protein
LLDLVEMRAHRFTRFPRVAPLERVEDNPVSVKG